MSACLFMAYVNNLGFAEPVDGIEYGHVVDANNGKHMLYLQLCQRIGD
jgi:hypothetical protein